MSSFDTAQAATNREQARRADGKFGEQQYTRAGIDLDDTTASGPHPAGEPETNPALAHLQPTPWCGTTRWYLDTDDAARYAESIDSDGARRLVQTCQVGAGLDRGDEFRVDALGRFDAFLEPDGKTLGSEGEGDTYLLEADDDTLRLLLNAERNQYGERAEDAGVAVSEVDIDATTGTVRSMSVACDLHSAGVTHQSGWHFVDIPADELPETLSPVTSWNPGGIQQLSDQVTTDRALWELRRRAADDYTQTHPVDTTVRDAAMRPHPVGEQPIPVRAARDLRDHKAQSVADTLERARVDARAVPTGRARLDMGESTGSTVIHYYRTDPDGHEQHLAIEHLGEDPDTSLTAAHVLTQVLRDSTYADRPLSDYITDYAYDDELEEEVKVATAEHQKIIDDTRRARAFLGDDTFTALRNGAAS